MTHFFWKAFSIIVLHHADRFQTMEECLEAAEPECSFVTGQHYDLQIPYFCGHDEHCT